jgi:hypothetical protein
MAYDPLADAIRENGGPPSGVTAALPSGYDPLAEAEKRQDSPLKVPYRNGQPDNPYATNPNDDAYGGRPGSQGMPFVSGAIRGVLDAADTGTNVLRSIFPAPADTDAARAIRSLIRGAPDTADTDTTARLKADRDAWKKQYGDSTAAQIGRVGGQIASTAGPAGLIGKGIGAVSQGLPAALRLLTQGAAQGGTQAGMTASGYDESTGEQIAKGAITGGVAGPVIGKLTGYLDTLRGFYGGIRPEIATLADKARQLGMTIPVNAMTPNQQARMFTNALRTLPGTGEDAAALARQRQFQGALMKEGGSAADTMGVAEMKAMRDNISAGYDTALGRVTAIPHSPQLVNDLSNVGVDATRVLDPNAASYVGKAIREIHDAFGGGPITGTAYKSLTASDGILAKISAAAPEAAGPYLAQINQALKQQLTRSAPPGTAADLLRLDKEWRAMHTIRPLAEKSGTGDIQPAALLQSTINQAKKFDGPASGVAFSDDALPELGRIGKQFFGHIPESGTAPRTQAYEFAHHPFRFTAGILPGLAVGRPLRAWADSSTVSGRVIDTSLGGPRPDPNRAVPVFNLLGLDAQR